MSDSAEFSLKLTTPQIGVTYFELNLPMFPSPVLEFSDDCVDYGHLFAYLFRRFGYPNLGWDDHKELVKYILTTPMPEMLLQVVPYCGNPGAVAFTFLVPADVAGRLKDYTRQEFLAWRNRMFDWVEANGLLPEWIDEGLSFLQSECKKSLTWRETYDSLAVIHAQGDSGPVSIGRNWQLGIEAQYAEIEPVPVDSILERSLNWREWPDEDPAKAYAQASYDALHDLKRAVYVRDIAIDAFGPIDYEAEPEVFAEHAESAGYPSGSLGNAAPDEFSKLQHLVTSLGSGDAAEGIRRATTAIETVFSGYSEEVPAETGFYWVRPLGNPDKKRIVEIYDCGDTLMIRDGHDTVEPLRVFTAFESMHGGVEWKGPIRDDA